MAKKMVSFRLEESRLQELKILADAKNVSATKLLEAIIRTYYKEQLGELPKQTFWRKGTSFGKWVDELLGIVEGL